jgi:predicted MFS family arabinose efflux permease
MSTSTVGRARVPLVAYVLAVGTFLMATSEFVVAGLLTELAHDFSIDVPAAGLVITVFAIGMVASPVLVVLTLRLPHRSTLVALLLLFALGHVVAALSPVLAVLLAARFVTALATGAFWAVSGLVAAQAAGDGSASRAIGLISAGGMLATVVGVPLGAVAGQISGWRGPFWALAVLAAGAAALIARLVPRSTGEQEEARTLRRELAALRSVRMWMVLLTCVFVAAGVLSVYSFVSPLLTGRTGLPEDVVPIALVAYGIAALMGTLVASALGDHRPYATLIVNASITLVALIVLLAVSTLPVPTVVVFGVLGLSGFSANPILGLLVLKYGGDAPTLANGLTPAAFNLGTAIGTGIAGAALRGPLGPIAPVVVGVVAAAVVVVAAIAITVVRPRNVAVVDASCTEAA